MSLRLMNSTVKTLSITKKSFHSTSFQLKHFDANSAQFETSIQQSKVTLVDFFGVWCNPCKVLAPVLAKVIPENHEGADLVKVDIDKEQELAAKYKIASLPTVIAFRDGKQIGKFVGSRNEAGVREFMVSIGLKV